jgi:tRNA G18 (ribose-2'-O)-methylase SpoU
MVSGGYICLFLLTFGGILTKDDLTVNANSRTMRKLKNSELNRLTPEEFKAAEKIPLVVVLDNVRSLNNIGSVFRTSDAFLVDRIFLCGITATPPNKEIHKTALGATDSVAWSYAESAEDLIKRLRSEGFRILSVEQAESSVPLNHFHPKPGQKYAVVFGNEVKGVQQRVVDLSDECLEIPQFGTKHSLNISVSCGIVLWDLYAKLRF